MSCYGVLDSGNWVAGLMKKAGVKIPGSSHLWRHSCATGMLEGGADIRYIHADALAKDNAPDEKLSFLASTPEAASTPSGKPAMPPAPPN